LAAVLLPMTASAAAGSNSIANGQQAISGTTARLGLDRLRLWW
jgi:hypothetical protein